ncbi:hypothetical protein KIN20_027812 [Parelaphostrongylus tenuis]|uniref:Uncharacterized protein n=1 Tax=Parelaphostrongylus tenuis TaxID=148309 RepID=A0AAD5QZU7_PARTN|nr:hypothetical protein KIN20_027812 [Parelaphostrongylus tenuis]
MFCFQEQNKLPSPCVLAVMLIFDEVSNTPLADPELPKPFCASSSPDFVELDSGSSECFPKQTT